MKLLLIFSALLAIAYCSPLGFTETAETDEPVVTIETGGPEGPELTLAPLRAPLAQDFQNDEFPTINIPDDGTNYIL